MTELALSDFLLARITEDEAYARGGAVAPPSHWVAMTRIVTECAGKRRIVEDLAHLEERGQAGPLLAHARWTAEILAEPYADHPDYRDDWRP